ncbi:MAG: hypothetical protein WAW87_03975 [Candidatus Ferrigenium altingense]
MKGFTAYLKDKLLDLLEDLKRAHKSLTVWFNGVGIGVMLADVAARLPLMQEILPQLQPFMSPDAYQILSALLAIGNTMLRFKTTTALRNKQ